MSMKSDMRLPLAVLLTASAMLPAACGSSGGGLIPAGNAGPLRADFEAVAAAAEKGNGNCSATRAAIARTESDFRNLPSGVNAALRAKLSEGIGHLSSQAQVECAQPSNEGATTTASATTSSSPSTATSTTTSTTTTTESSITSSSSSPPPSPSGGTPAEEGEDGEHGGGPPAGETGGAEGGK